MEHGSTPQDCNEPKQPTSGPTFEISQRSHEIMQEFERLSHEDKRKLVDVIVSCESAAICARERNVIEVMADDDGKLMGRQGN